jgi:hypothetical protein
MVVAFDRQGWITLLAALLLALITLLTSYDHVDIPGRAAPLPLPQQAGIPCLLAALAAAALETQLASNDRQEGRDVQARAEVDRIRAEAAAAEERERAAGRARRQDRCALAQLEFQLNPDDTTSRRLANLIALLREYGEMG